MALTIIKVTNNLLIYNQVSKLYEDLKFHIDLKHLQNIFWRNKKFDCEKVDFQKKKSKWFNILKRNSENILVIFFNGFKFAWFPNKIYETQSIFLWWNFTTWWIIFRKWK